MENSSKITLDSFTTGVVYEDVTEVELFEFETIDLAASSVAPISDPINVVALHHRVVVTTFWIGVAVIGLFGNGLVIVSVAVSKKLRTITNILVVNLAVADFVSCLCLPFLSVISLDGRYPLSEALCAAVAGTIRICVCASVSNLVVIAFVRWYVITKSVRGHQGIHTPRKIFTAAVIIWVESIAFMILPPVLGVGELGYSQFYAMCATKDNHPLAKHYSALQGGLMVVGLAFTLTLYALILSHVRAHNRQFRSKFADDDNNPVSTSERQGREKNKGVRPTPMIKTINQKEVEITKNLFTVVCIFILCFLPTALNYTIPGASIVTLYGTMITLTNSTVNPIIYGLKHPNFQEVFKSLLCCRMPTQVV